MRASAYTLCGPWRNTHCPLVWSVSTAARADSFCSSRCRTLTALFSLTQPPTATLLGTVTRTTPRFSHDYPPTLTAHDIGVKDLLDVFYIQGGGPDIVLYAITIDPKQPISMELSARAAKAAEEAVEKILAELNSNSAS